MESIPVGLLLLRATGKERRVILILLRSFARNIRSGVIMTSASAKVKVLAIQRPVSQSNDQIGLQLKWNRHVGILASMSGILTRWRWSANLLCDKVRCALARRINECRVKVGILLKNELVTTGRTIPAMAQQTQTQAERTERWSYPE
jgi:hypothetical protein